VITIDRSLMDASQSERKPTRSSRQTIRRPRFSFFSIFSFQRARRSDRRWDIRTSPVIP